MVDAELAAFEDNLRNGLEFILTMGIHRGMWYEFDELTNENHHDIEDVIDLAFHDIMYKYSLCQSVWRVLEHGRILFQNTVWAAMNVPYPRNVNTHVHRVIDNSFNAYNNFVYVHLRTEMIMANHSVHILQRKWRVCASDPEHPACQRRLMREFNELTT